MATKKNLDYYLGLKWTFTIEQESHEGQGYYVISVNELPGVCTDAETIEEGVTTIQEAIGAAIKLYLKQGDPIPEPVNKKKFRGNIAYRTSPERHCMVAKLANQKHKSLSRTLDILIDAGLDHLQQRYRI